MKTCSLVLLATLLSCATVLQPASATDNGDNTCNANAKLIFAINTDGPGEKVLVINVSDSQTIQATVSGIYMEEGKPKEIRVTKTLRPGINAYIGKTVYSKPGLAGISKTALSQDEKTQWSITGCTTL